MIQKTSLFSKTSCQVKTLFEMEGVKKIENIFIS